jgi:hypothetical protein
MEPAAQAATTRINHKLRIMFHAPVHHTTAAG